VEDGGPSKAHRFFAILLIAGNMQLNPKLLTIPADGINFGVWHWHGSGMPTLFFLHATGFHARVWDQVIARLDFADCYAMNIRGHGQSDTTTPPLSWRLAGNDVVRVTDKLALRGAVGIGHSMGGHSLCIAAATKPELFSCLILIDPVIQREKYYRGAQDPKPDYANHPVARRRNAWASAEEMYERFKDKPPFSRWQKDVLKDYCAHALRGAQDKNGYVLACAPLLEASIYAQSTAPDALIYDDLKKLEMPVLIIRLGIPRDDDDLNFDVSPTKPELASHFKNGQDMHIAEHTHFMPMENPELTADLINKFMLKTNIATNAEELKL
jgi:lipase